MPEWVKDFLAGLFGQPITTDPTQPKKKLGCSGCLGFALYFVIGVLSGGDVDRNH